VTLDDDMTNKQDHVELLETIAMRALNLIEEEQEDRRLVGLIVARAVEIHRSECNGKAHYEIINESEQKCK
jgi:hypothetical protein